MTDLEFINQLASAAMWARPAHSGCREIVVLFSGTLPYGVGCEFQKRGLMVMAGQWYGRGRSAGRAVKLAGSPSMLQSILRAVPAPRSRGSRTAGNLLPW